MKEKEALDSFLNIHDNCCSISERYLEDNPEISKLLSKATVEMSDRQKIWLSEPYQTNKRHPENLIHKIPSGLKLRSKSEALIAMSLEAHHIPFRYECAKILNNITIYPDFTILHPFTYEEMYWEHFGIADDIKYQSNISSKMQLYMSNNMIPSINLITTYETKDRPLDISLVDTLIKHYFM